MTVTVALSLPMLISGSASGFISSAGGMGSAASAVLTKGGSAVVVSKAVASAKVALRWQNSRRVIRTGSSVGQKRRRMARG